MKLKQILLSLSILLLVSGCSSVRTKYPLINNPDESEQDKLEGAWLLDNEMIFYIGFPSTGLVQIAYVECGSNKFNIVRGAGTVTKSNKRGFISFRFPGVEYWNEDYMLFEYASWRDDLILWGPNDEAFEDLIKKATLKGYKKTTGDSTFLTITNTSEEVLEVIGKPEYKDLFDYRQPHLLRKITPTNN